MQKMRQADYFQATFFIKKLYEVKASGLQLSFNVLLSSDYYTIKTSCIELETIGPEICLILNF